MPSGTIRVVFTAAGAEVARADYLPFGERFHTTGPLPSQQFTGQQRDPEAQLDHSNARSYQTTTGRFTGIDLVYSGMFDPQQWNRYAYARNNPLRYVDPSGLVAQALTCKDMRIDGVTYNICDSVTVVGDGGGGGGGGGGSGSGIPGRSFPDPGRTGPGGTDEPFASGGIARGGAPPPTNPDGTPKPPPKGIPAPPEWGSPDTYKHVPPDKPGARDKWVPNAPKGQGQNRPQIHWDPQDEYWTLDDGSKKRSHYNENGQRVPPGQKPVYPLVPSMIYKFFNPLLIIVNPCVLQPSVCGIEPVYGGTIGPT